MSTFCFVCLLASFCLINLQQSLTSTACDVYNHDMKESVSLNYSCTSQKPGAKWHITFTWTGKKGLANVMNHSLHDIYCVRCIIATAHMRTWSIMWKDLFTFGDVQPSCKTLPKVFVMEVNLNYCIDFYVCICICRVL